jgi:hypothetical protein
VKGFLRSLLVAASLLGSTCGLGHGQSYSIDSGTLGAGVKVSTLGAGAEAAVRVTQRTNVRAGFNMIAYSRGFNQDGVAYNGRLSFKTLEAHYDIFPAAKGFHVSPGVLVYAGDPLTATAAVPAKQSFSLGGVNYSSDPANPVTGGGKIDFNRASPMITVGWGNLISRQEGKHFSVPVELGVAFQGSPQASLALAGSVRFDWVQLPTDPVRSHRSSQHRVRAGQDQQQNVVFQGLSDSLGGIRIQILTPAQSNATRFGSSRNHLARIARCVAFLTLGRRLRLLRWNRPPFRPEDMIDKVSQETGSDQDHTEGERTHPQNRFMLAANHREA